MYTCLHVSTELHNIIIMQPLNDQNKNDLFYHYIRQCGKKGEFHYNLFQKSNNFHYLLFLVGILLSSKQEAHSRIKGKKNSYKEMFITALGQSQKLHTIDLHGS